MLRDFILIVLPFIAALILSYIFHNMDIRNKNKSVVAFIALVFYIIAALLAIRFVIHFFVVIGRIW